MPKLLVYALFLQIFVHSTLATCGHVQGAVVDEDLLSALRADWTAQERQLRRTPSDRVALLDVFDRIERLLRSWDGQAESPDFSEESRRLERLKERAGLLNSGSSDLPNQSGDLSGRSSVSSDQSSDSSDWSNGQSSRLNGVALYEEARLLARDVALKHPRLRNKPILFMKQRRFVCQMLHEYVGYFYDFGGVQGGGIEVLLEPGQSLKTRSLTDGLLPQGAYSSPALSYDGQTVYFAFCPVQNRVRTRGEFNNWHSLPAAKDAPTEFNWNSPARNNFHVYSVNKDGTNLRQLTDGMFDDFDPIPLPNGRIAFMSSRRGGYCRCNNPFEPLPTYTLHSMNEDGSDIRTLSRHETNEWNPAVLNDGRIVYTRWDYVDRSAAHFHGLWASNPDGTAPVVLFGNYTMNISACYQPKPIPHSNKIAFIAGAHHALIGGSLVLFDPNQAKYDEITGEDSFDSLERLTPDVCFPETEEGWPRSYYSCPEPLSEDHFLVAYSFKPLPAFGTNYLEDSKSGLYYFDRFGNKELLYRDSGISAVSPIVLEPKVPGPNLPSQIDVDLAEQQEGEFMLTDVKWSLFPLPTDRPIRQLRIYQVLPKEEHIANDPRIGHANAESARALLGTVPVEEDGSAFFRAPAEIPLYFQAVDEQGRAVQSMRSITYLQAGERRSCVGCHEPISTTPDRGGVRIAFLREPSRIEPGPDGTRPFSFSRLVQPVLDAHCVRCHFDPEQIDSLQNGQIDSQAVRTTDRVVGTVNQEVGTMNKEVGIASQEVGTMNIEVGTGPYSPVLTGELTGCFTRSYEELLPYLRFYEWGGRSISPIVTRPGECGADASPLSSIWTDEHHKEVLKMTPLERNRLELWLDSNVPFYGTFDRSDQKQQQLGEIVPFPSLQ
ncbi:MAG: hypothetical protein ACRC10_09895 [Thermoguttaceae bacterium]